MVMDWLKKKTPPAEPKMAIRDTLFGDMPFADWPRTPIAQEPWSSFASARDALARGDKETAIALLVKIADTEGLESRHYLQAWHFLRPFGVLPPRAEEKKIHGVVIELAWNGGLDLIVAYSDLKARYYNYSGAGVVWEHPDDSLDAVIHELLDVGWAVAVKLTPWTGVRPAIPPQGHFRINLLAPGGLHFGQGPIDALSSDPLAQPVFAAGHILMRELIKKAPRGKE